MPPLFKSTNKMAVLIMLSDSCYRGEYLKGSQKACKNPPKQISLRFGRNEPTLAVISSLPVHMQPALGALSTVISLQIELLLFSSFGSARDQYTLPKKNKNTRKENAMELKKCSIFTFGGENSEVNSSIFQTACLVQGHGSTDLFFHALEERERQGVTNPPCVGSCQQKCLVG